MSGDRIFLLTGYPGSGKTTAMVKAVDMLKERGVSVDGFVTLEVRERGSRVGFKAIDLTTGVSCWLAKLGAEGNMRVGRYTLLLHDFEILYSNVFDRSRSIAQVVAVDEIGPMEMRSPLFLPAVRDQINAGKILLATIHRSIHGSSKSLLGRTDIMSWEVNQTNRELLPSLICDQIERSLRTEHSL